MISLVACFQSDMKSGPQEDMKLANKPKIILIVSCGYSGSTLLDLILGSHSDIIGLGELKDFDLCLDSNQLCTCWKLHSRCPFWNTVRQKIAHRNEGLSFRINPPGVSSAEILNRTIEVYSAIHHVSSTNFLVDSSKGPDRARLLQESGQIESYIIHLIRDGRGVAFSYVKRGESFKSAASHWVELNLRILAWLRGTNVPPHITVRYEELATQADNVVSNVCRFLGVSWEPSMLFYRDGEHHNISGNHMRFLRSRAFEKLYVDVEWKSRLTADQLAIFNDVDTDLRPFLHND